MLHVKGSTESEFEINSHLNLDMTVKDLVSPTLTLPLILLALTVPSQAAVLALYDFTGFDGTSDAPYASADADPNSVAGGFSLGAGLGTNGNWNTSNNGIDSTQFGSPLPSFAQKARNTVTSQELSFTSDAYWSLAITPNAGYEMGFTGLSFDVRTYAGTVNSLNFYLSSNIDGFDSPVGSVTTGYNTAGNFQTVTFDLSASGFQNLDSATEFRVYFWWDAGAGTGSGSAPRFDNVTLNGSVAPIPEASSALLCGLGLVSLLGRFRRR